MITCAIVGATGIVGSTILKILEEKKLKIDEYYLFASSKSKGKKITFMDKEYVVQELTMDTPKGNFTYAIFSCGATQSKKYANEFVKYGTTVIDNSSAFRMDQDIPLVVPEINIADAYEKKLIANPNCSTIQAVSGAGKSGIDDLINTSKGMKEEKFPYPIYNNCIPQIDVFADNDYTKEELKMINETRKILKIPDLDVTATCVRVPTMNSHSESINIELYTPFNIQDVKQILSRSPSIVVLDDIRFLIYPLNTFANGKDEVFVGRIRRDLSVKNGLNLWIVADNIRKGAATNAVQILEQLIKRKDLEN